MSRASARATVSLALAIGMVALACGPALAHQERKVGRYHFAVGFGDEPAYAGLKNSVQLFLSNEKTGKSINNLGPTLQVQVSYQGQKMAPITMEPDFEIGESGTPGDYRGWFIPTRPGVYSFHFAGSIRGQKVNEIFKSGPKTFSNVEDPQSVEFPAKDPTAGQLSDLLNRETSRLNADITTARSNASDQAAGNRNLTLVALALAVIALIVGALGMRRKTR
jgi:hypothetical protein